MIKKIILSLLLSCSIASLHSMQEAAFSDLPQDIIHSIFLKLAEEQSFEISLKNMVPFAATNKDIYTLFSTDKKLITDIINNLKNPDLQVGAYKTIALELNTQAALATLKEYINTGDAKVTNDLQQLLAEIPCCATPNIQLAKKLLACGVQGNGDTLVNTIAHNRVEFFHLYLSYSTEVDTRSSWDDRTPLMQAALDNKTKIASILIQRKADINARNSQGNTALIWAAKCAAVKIVDLLLQAGANPFAQNNANKKALEFIPEECDVYYSKAKREKTKELLEQAEQVYETSLKDH
jgi:ankyrin repeat protein